MHAMSADAPREPPDPASRDLIVIGASAGGVQVLLDLAVGLPADTAACVLVVLHVGAHRSLLPELMSARGALPARHPHDGEALAPGVIFIAPPDQHMLVDGDHIRLVRGPKENFARPAIDPLFRTAALSHGARVIGVVLSGRLDDGTTGLQMIKQCGGMAVVQDPLDAEQPEMPISASAHVDVDRCVPAAQLAQTLLGLIEVPSIATTPVEVSQIALDQAVSSGEGDPMKLLQALGHPSRFACPECSGVLWEIDNCQPRRFRCHTGHGFTLRSLAHTQNIATDEALWSAMRALQEREALLRTLAQDGESDADGRQGDGLLGEADRTAAEAERLRKMITS
jgi:two-component system, chemotaxis family, protein-glutamate methylesterase/glutaminase